jgi:hypothetical protein
MTRAATIRRAIATAIEGATPDARAHVDDRFRHLDAGSIDPDSAPDRVFTLTLAAQPSRIEVNNCDTFRVEYTVTMFYAAMQAGVEDRIASDAERIYAKVERLFETVSGVMRVDVAPVGLTEASPSSVTSSYSVIVVYKLDAAVVTA